MDSEYVVALREGCQVVVIFIGVFGLLGVITRGMRP